MSLERTLLYLLLVRKLLYLIQNRLGKPQNQAGMVTKRKMTTPLLRFYEGKAVNGSQMDIKCKT
jgi:hypothetical protein